MYMIRFASLERVTLKDTLAQTCRTGAREERIEVLGRSMASHSKRLKEVAEGGFQIEVDDGEISRFSPMIVSYCP